jgi:hypothetical protein
LVRWLLAAEEEVTVVQGKGAKSVSLEVLVEGLGLPTPVEPVFQHTAAVQGHKTQVVAVAVQAAQAV